MRTLIFLYQGRSHTLGIFFPFVWTCGGICFSIARPFVQHQATPLHSFTFSSNLASKQTETIPSHSPLKTQIIECRFHSCLCFKREVMSQAELCWLGKGTITHKVKWLFLPVSMWLSSALHVPGVLQCLNWFLKFSYKVFWSIYCC